MDKPLTIGHYYAPLDPKAGGVVTSLTSLVSSLSKADTKSILFTRGPTDDHLRQSLPSIITFRLSDFLFRHRNSCRSIDQCDVIHIHGLWDIAGLLLARTAESLGVPVVLSPHGMADDWSIAYKPIRKKIYQRLFRRSFQRFNGVHCTSNAERRQLKRNLQIIQSPATVIPLPVEAIFNNKGAFETNDFRSSYDGARAIEILFIGRLHPVKNIERTLDAVAEINKRGFPIRFHIVGPGSETYIASLKGYADRNKIPHLCEFHGMVTELSRKRELLHHCDLFISPSQQENFGLALIEAVIEGVPAITTRQVGIWEELESFGVRIVEPSGPELANEILRMMSQPLHERCPDFEAVQRWLDPIRIGHCFRDFYRSAMK